MLTFLGLELDSNLLEIRFPADKLAHLQSLISSWLHREFCIGKELESLVSYLGQGKGFYDACLNCYQSFRSDLLWRYTFLAPLNGIDLTRTLAPCSFQVSFASDASGSI